MMPNLNGVVLAVISSPAASIVAKATVATALCLLGTWLARRSRAAVRHALLTAAFGVLLLLPIASLVAPPVRIALRPATQQRTAPALAAATRAIAPLAAAHSGPGIASAVPGPAEISLAALWLAAWMAGTALFLLPVAMGLWQVRRLRRSALPWRQGQPVAERLALDAGIHRRVAVLLHGALPGPMTCGVVHPVILLSEDAQNWEGEDLTRALVHELEHVRRFDWVSHCLARAVCAVYWFHPLVWMAWRQFALEAERSCDDAVLGRSEATAYADQLVGLARRLSLAAKSPAAKSPLLAMANRADLATRVGAVLDSRQRRGRAGTLPVALACAGAVALVLTLSPLRMVAAPQSASADVPVAAMPQYSATTSLVMVDAVVSDKNGQNIEGLTAGDFAISEDGVPQIVSIFEFQKLTLDPAAPAPQRPVSSYYILGYYTSNLNMDGTFRRIRITSKLDTGSKLDFRMGYYANKSAPGTAESVSADNSIGPDTRAPILLSKKEPAYSDAARKAKHQGTVVLYVDVDASGAITNIQVIRSLGLGLDEKAIEAVQQWKFLPGKKAGKPVSMQAQVTLNFRLL
jgi:TonB family protein